MDNLKRHFGGGSKGCAHTDSTRSVFHVALPLCVSNECQACFTSTQEYIDSAIQMGGAGTRCSHAFSTVLKDTQYGTIAGQVEQAVGELESLTAAEGRQLKSAMESLWAQLSHHEEGTNQCQLDKQDKQRDAQIVAQGLLGWLQTQEKMFAVAIEHLAKVLAPGTLGSILMEDGVAGQSNTPNHQSASEPESSEPLNCLEGHSHAKHASPSTAKGDSPSGIRKHVSSLLSKLGSSTKPAATSSSESGGAQTSWYIDLDGEQGEAGSSPSTDASPNDSSNPISTHKSAGQSNTDASSKTGINSEGATGSQSNTVRTAGQSSGDAHTHRLSVNRSELACQQPAQSIPKNGLSKLPGAGLSPHCHLATQEELDAVIDILSGSHKYSMHAIPENLLPAPTAPPPHHPISLVPTVHLPSSSPSHPASMEVTAPMGYHSAGRSHLHRQSDGLLEEMMLSKDTKTNTWPFRPRQKEHLASLGVDFSQKQQQQHQLLGPPFHAGGNFDGTVPGLREFEMGAQLLPAGRGKQRYDPSQFLPPSCSNPWSMTTDIGGQRGWPVFPLVTESGDLMAHQWSTMADSSSCSDESSNGDLHWMMALNHITPPTGKRRHSSGGEQHPNLGAPNHIVKSADDLLEPKSTNTWPPKHPWMVRPPVSLPPAGPSPDAREELQPQPHAGPKPAAHRPLVTQWSDPLTSRPLSVFEPGSSVGLSHQPSFDSMPTGGNSGTSATHTQQVPDQL